MKSTTQNTDAQNAHVLGDISLELVWEILNGKDFDELGRSHKFMK